MTSDVKFRLTSPSSGGRNRSYHGIAQPPLLRPHRRTRQHHPRLGASADRATGSDPARSAARRRARRCPVHPRQPRRPADRGRAKTARQRPAHPARCRARRRRDPGAQGASQRQDHPRRDTPTVPGRGAGAVRPHARALSADRTEGGACRHGTARGVHRRRACRSGVDDDDFAQPADRARPGWPRRRWCW